MGWYHIKFKPTDISETCLHLRHLGSDMTGHPAHLDYISTPGQGLWQDTSQRASWMESTDHCTSPWFKLDTSIVHLSKLIMGCYVKVITTSLFSLFRMGVKPYQKPDDEERASFWNTDWFKKLDVDVSISGLYWTLLAGHIYHATEIIDNFPSICFKLDVYVTIHRAKFLIIKPTRCTNFSNLFLEKNSTCFGQFLCPSLGVFHCTHSNDICHIGLLTACEQDQYQDGTDPDPNPARKLSANLYDIYHCCVYSEKLLMMDGGTVRNMWSFILRIYLRN